MRSSRRVGTLGDLWADRRLQVSAAGVDDGPIDAADARNERSGWRVSTLSSYDDSSNSWQVDHTDAKKNTTDYDVPEDIAP